MVVVFDIFSRTTRGTRDKSDADLLANANLTRKLQSAAGRDVCRQTVYENTITRFEIDCTDIVLLLNNTNVKREIIF